MAIPTTREEYEAWRHSAEARRTQAREAAMRKASEPILWAYQRGLTTWDELMLSLAEAQLTYDLGATSSD